MNNLKRTALPVPCRVRFFLWVLEGHNGAKTPPRRARMRQDGPRCLQDVPKMPQDASKRPQEASKRPSRGPKIDFSSQLGPPEPQNSLKIYYEYNSFGPLSNFCIRSMFYCVFAPKWLQFGIKFRPRRLQEAPRRPKLVPKTAQEPPKRRPRRLKNHPRAAQEASWRRPRASLEPDDAQEQPQSRPKAAQTPLQTSILDHFGNNLIEILDHF